MQDIREEYGGTKKVAVVSGGARKKVAVDDKYNHPSGKFVERVGDDVGKERGPSVCGFCGGVCCSAMRYLINVLVDFGEVEPKLKVCLVYTSDILNLLLRTIRMLLNACV